MSHKEFDFVITMDADGQHDFRDIPSFVTVLAAGADLVVGQRPQKARLMEKLFGIFTSCVWGVADPLCGMKGYRTSLLRIKKVAKTYDSVGTEVLMFALTKGFDVESIPISVQERDGKPRFTGFLRANLIIGFAFAIAVSNAIKSLVLGFLAPHQK
jgi:hypothetical protein